MIFDKVLEFAKIAHGTQKRKYTDEPYTNHCVRVADTLLNISCDDAMVYAALLHDVIEDTKTTKEEIYNFFLEETNNILANEVVSLVIELTDVSKPSDGNRKVRKEIDRAHLANITPKAKTVKLADIIDNTVDITKNDKNFAKMYIPEIMELLKVLKEGEFDLYIRACYEVYKAHLELFDYEMGKKEITINFPKV